VTETLAGKETFKREYDPINSIRDHYPKYILTGEDRSSQENGVKILSVYKWLLQ
jgi:predicted AAA+ superfamily ATPase